MKWRHCIYPFTVALIVLASCTGNDKKSAGETTSEDSNVTSSIIDTAIAAETIDTFNTSGFSTYAKQHAQGFDWAKFRMINTWTDNTLLTSAFHPEKRYFEAYGRFLKYSPDSSHFIDLDSYNVDIKKDKKGHWYGTEVGPDTEVSLVDPKSGKKTRLLFMGPGNSVEDGLWLDNNNLVLMGVQDADSTLQGSSSSGKNTGKTAAVWRYNVPTNTFYLYELHNDTTAKQIMGYWRKERLKEVMQQQ